MRLILMRHGKAQPDAPKGDAARKLTEGGAADVRRVAAWLRDHGLAPKQASVSPSVRTRQTFEALPDEWRPQAPTYAEALYNASLPAMLEELDAMRCGREDALIVGHNPGVSALLMHLVPESADPMRPGDAAVIEWREGGGATLLHYVRAADLREE